MMTGAPVIGAFIALWGFWGLLLVGWIVQELDVRRLLLFVGLWAVGRLASGYVLEGVLFAPYVAVLDIALVFAIFKGDVRLR
jgi:hypothetical protein